MNKLIITSILLCLTMNAAHGAAFQQSGRYVALVSDYVWRGLTRTDNSPALQLALNYQNGNAYSGTWLSNVQGQDEAEGVPVEMDVYFGYDFKLGAFNLDLSITTFNYLNDSDQDLTEFSAATWLSKNMKLKVNREVKTNYWYPELKYKKHLPDHFYVEAELGLWNYDEGNSNPVSARFELARDFPEFNHLDAFIAFTHITDGNPQGSANSDDDNSQTEFLFGLRMNF